MAIGGDAPWSDLDVPRWVGFGLITLLYFTVFLMWSVLSHAFVTFPLMRHYAQTFTIRHPLDLAQVSQRERDEFAEAEGFAGGRDEPGRRGS